jgi:hypothetical protein
MVSSSSLVFPAFVGFHQFHIISHDEAVFLVEGTTREHQRRSADGTQQFN